MKKVTLTDPHVKLYRDAGRIVKCEVFSDAQEVAIDLPVTGVSFDTPVNTLGDVSLRIHGSRVRFIDKVPAS